MGSCFSVSFSCDQVVNQVSNYLCSKAANIHNLEQNLGALQIAVQELKEMRDDLLRRVNIEENRGLQRLTVVQGWLSRVEAIETQADDLLNARTIEIQKLCLCGYASKNCVCSYQYGQKVFKGMKDVEYLKSNGNFEVVAEGASSSKVDKKPIQPTIGMEATFEEAWNRLMEDGVGILGLYGMGGVGKTTILTRINNRFCEPKNTFDVVIWVVASKNLQLKRIQEDIGKKLGIFNEGWQQKRQDEKASDIFGILNQSKFVLLLDDMWNKVDLTDIGVPVPHKENGC